MNFPSGAIYIWSGTNATIPTGWERVTALDGLYPKGTADATNPNDTGGNATHTHTGSTHSHADTHTHTVTVGAGTGGSQDTGSGSTAPNQNHTHTATCGAISGGGLSNISCTYSAISNDPPFYEVIFITPTSGVNELPANAIYLYDDDDSKAGHYLCNGSNSTPNLVDKYLKGAGTGANAGTTGGSVTNVHELTHTHTVASHDHANTTTGQASVAQGSNDTEDNDVPPKTHTHTINPSATTATISATAPELTTTETVEPAYTKLVTVQNRTGHGDARVGMIGMWLGTLANIPSNYYLCDGTNGTQDMRGKYHKSTATTGEVGDTGGSNTHTHASQNHTHTAGGTHTHTHANLTHSGLGTIDDTDGNSVVCAFNTTSHTVTFSDATSVYANAATTGDEQNNEPSYRTVAFIKLNSTGSSASMLMNFL